MTPTRYILLYLLPLVLYSSFIFYTSSISDLPTIRGIMTQEPVPKGAWTGDQIEHIAVYSVLAFLFYRAVMQTRYKNVGVIATIFFCVAFGLLDEVHQAFVPGRTFSLLDLFWNFIGSLFVRVVAS